MEKIKIVIAILIIFCAAPVYSAETGTVYSCDNGQIWKYIPYNGLDRYFRWSSVGKGYWITSSYQSILPSTAQCNSIGIITDDEVRCHSGLTQYCDSSAPEHCSNGIKDSGELGQDCGGPCPSLCKNDCPDGMILIQVGNAENGFSGTCVHDVPPKNGLCPAGYTYNAGGKYYDDPAVGGTGQTYTEAASCKKSIPAKLIPMDPADANQTYGYTDSELQAIANGWDGINRLSNLGSQVTYEETVDPVTGDVTMVRTETATKTDGNGNTTTKTSVKTTVMDADGKIKSETTIEQGEEPSDDPGDYNFPDGAEGWNDDSWIPEEEDTQGLFDGWWSTSPIGGLFNQSRLEMRNSASCMSMTIYGKTIPICFNHPALVSGYAVWRGMIIAVTYLAGFFYLVRRGG